MAFTKTLKPLFRLSESDVARLTPPAGERIVYAKTTGIFQKDSSGVESAVGGGGASAQDFIDASWDKKFFSDAGFLPSTKIFEYTGTPPALSGTPSGSFTREPGALRAGGAAIGYYDLGAAKSKILIVLGQISKFSSNHLSIGLTGTAPTGVDPTNSYSLWNDGGGVGIWKKIGAGSYVRLDSGNLGYSSGFDQYGAALYYDDATDTLTSFVRFAGAWHQATTTTNNENTTLRYFYFQSAAANQRWCAPIVCYAQ